VVFKRDARVLVLIQQLRINRECGEKPAKPALAHPTDLRVVAGGDADGFALASEVGRLIS
jgi:hypothetical protein